MADANLVSLTEAELIAKIIEEMPAPFWERFCALVTLRDAETLTRRQQKELISLSDRAEERNVERLQCLIELSRRRDVSVDDLKAQMGIRPVSLYYNNGD